MMDNSKIVLEQINNEKKISIVVDKNFLREQWEECYKKYLIDVSIPEKLTEKKK